MAEDRPCAYVLYEFDNVKNYKNGIDVMSDNNATFYSVVNSDNTHSFLVAKEKYDIVGNSLPGSSTYCTLQRKAAITKGKLRNLDVQSTRFLTGSCIGMNCADNKISMYLRQEKLS